MSGWSWSDFEPELQTGERSWGRVSLRTSFMCACIPTPKVDLLHGFHFDLLHFHLLFLNLLLLTSLGCFLKMNMLSLGMNLCICW